MHRDFQRVAEWYPPGEFIASVLRGADDAVVNEYSGKIEELLSVPHLLEMDDRTIEMCARWDDFCARLFHSYQDLALVEATSTDETRGGKSRELAGHK
jgi:hypothetical protein